MTSRLAYFWFVVGSRTVFRDASRLQRLGPGSCDSGLRTATVRLIEEFRAGRRFPWSRGRVDAACCEGIARLASSAAFLRPRFANTLWALAIAFACPAHSEPL